jgi:hypothetical protein
LTGRAGADTVGPMGLAIRSKAALLLGCLALALAAGAPAVAADENPVDQLRDMLAFRHGFLDVDVSYSIPARRAAQDRLRVMEREAGSLTEAQLIVALCRIAALADNAHTTCVAPTRQSTPVAFSAIGGGFFVTAASAEDADLLGSELAAIDGHDAASLRQGGHSLYGGLPAHRDIRMEGLLARPDLLQAMDLAEASKTALYRLRLADGRLVERRLAMGPPAGPDWRTLPAADAPPWALQERGTLFRFRDAPELGAVLVQLRENLDGKDQLIGAFLEKAEAERARLGRRNVVLDMRWNEGGNLMVIRDFLLAWPGKVGPRGRFFVLEGPHTFSAAMASIGYLKQAGRGRVILVGEPPGDRLMFFAEGSSRRLPHADMVYQPATERDDLQTGCRPYRDCFVTIAQPGGPTGTPLGMVRVLDPVFGRKPLEIASLEPDIAAPWTIEDLRLGVDPGLEAVRRALAKGP